MRLLLDTHILLAIIERRMAGVPTGVQALLGDPDNEHHPVASRCSPATSKTGRASNAKSDAPIPSRFRVAGPPCKGSPVL